MKYKIKSLFLPAIAVLLTVGMGCKKGAFDINSPNPNVASAVDPKYLLSAALTSSATIAAGNPGGASTTGNDLFNIYMGYWAVSGDYIPNSLLLTYKINTDFGASIWNNTYPTAENFKQIEGSQSGGYYTGISKIMESFLLERLVNIYNNIPYSQAVQPGNYFPKYDDAASVYKSLIGQLDTAILTINSTAATAANPGNYDVMFGGDMSQWIVFANTLKLKMLMNLTQMSGGPAYIQSELTGLTTDDFIGPDDDASVNPGYNNGANNQQNPLWQEIGWTTTLATYGDHDYIRSNAYAINFYKSTNDPRDSFFYAPDNGDAVIGRAFGSTALEHNTTISAVGGNTTGAPQSFGVLKSPAMDAVMISSTESLFLQAEAVQRGFLAGTAGDLYQAAVEESFRLLAVPGYKAAADAYIAQPGDKTNFAGSSNPIATIITQKWAALNTYDALETWNDWRRLGIPADLPVSIYPGTTAAHIPYRLLYPTSEYNYNAANVGAEGTIDQLSSKIFWMP